MQNQNSTLHKLSTDKNHLAFQIVEYRMLDVPGNIIDHFNLHRKFHAYILRWRLKYTYFLVNSVYAKSVRIEKRKILYETIGVIPLTALLHHSSTPLLQQKKGAV